MILLLFFTAGLRYFKKIGEASFTLFGLFINPSNFNNDYLFNFGWNKF